MALLHGCETTVTTVTSTNPRTGDITHLAVREADAAAVDAAVAHAVAATARLSALDRYQRADLLAAVADALDANGDAIVAVADEETALGSPRLRGELTRTTYQLRFFAEVIREGSYVEATLDSAGDTPMGPRPDLRRMLVPLGPVAVYAASNFPLAFSVAGGDTAAALAAGCGVVVKAHPAHPRTSELVASTIASVADDAVTVVHGFDAGLALVAAKQVRAASFTGSLHGGRALADLAASRSEPIPFYGELGSINPVLISPAAAQARSAEIAAGLAASVALGGGQFCTKPGIALVPTGEAGDNLVRELGAALARVEPTPALTAGMASMFKTGVAARAGMAGVIPLVTGDAADGWTAPALLEVPDGELVGALSEECFGPLTIVARYGADAEAVRTISGLPNSLTATLFLEPNDATIPGARRALTERAGRILYNGYPTGVAVSWAQNHGGSWPSTNSIHTSVGASSIRRFLRPVAWQNAPQSELPLELQDDYVDIPRRMDGALTLPSAPVAM